MYFDTHCHLNFSRFKGKVDEVIKDALHSGVTHIVIPGTDRKSSEKAVEIATHYENIYAAVGIHPHHVFGMKESSGKQEIMTELDAIKHLLTNKKVVAVGEVGLDRHEYNKTKYSEYTIDDNFMRVQKELLIAQISLATEYNKSLILHNREAGGEFLKIIEESWDNRLNGRVVFHCCEADDDLLEFARKRKIFIGVDGDVTYNLQKQEFVKKIPVSLLVAETDSPYLLPEPFRSLKQYPNSPSRLRMIVEFVAKLKDVQLADLQDVLFQNSITLFGLT